MQAKSAETRYGAFRALHTRSPDHPAVYGQRYKDFFLHNVAVDDEPMVHFSRSKRPEIVVFGSPKCSDDFLYVETGLTMRSAGAGKMKLVHYSKVHGREEVVCSTNIKDIIDALAGLNFSYGKMLRIFRDAKQADTLGCRLVVNAVPTKNRDYGIDELETEESSKFAKQTTPELFRNGSEQKTRKIARVSTDLVRGNGKEESAQKGSTWSKMMNVFKRDKDSSKP